MKKRLIITLALIFALGMAGCGAAPAASAPASSAPPPESAPVSENPAETSGSSAGKTELVVFAAASLTESLEEIAALYQKARPNVKITFNFDSSGTLKTQIQEGAGCDLFLSAGQKQMDQLDIAAPASVNGEQLDFVVADSRLDLLENRVALVVPPGNPKGIKTFDDLAVALQKSEILMAMGNSDVPVGQYTQKILEYYKLDEQALSAAGVLSYGSNVKEVTAQVSEAGVDCGVIYCTDAFSAKLDIAGYATADMCGQVIYPAAVMKSGKNPQEARAFLDYLTTGEAMAVFEGVGFTKP